MADRPPLTPSQMNEALIADPVRSKQILERIPAGRWGSGEDFEGAVVFLASRASDYVSGECLVVDGGWMGSESSGDDVLEEVLMSRIIVSPQCLPDIPERGFMHYLTLQAGQDNRSRCPQLT